VDDLVGMTPSYILATDPPCYYGGVVVSSNPAFGESGGANAPQ
jgi:hypothetical protein